ncbi:hypothetical protein QP162_10405 [Sphingomonas aurantiaca]
MIHSMSWRGMPVQAQIKWRDLDLALDGGIAKPERRIGLDDWFVPTELTAIDQLGEQERRHTLGVRRNHESRVCVDWIGLADGFHADAAFLDDAALIDEGVFDAGNAISGHRVAPERLELVAPCGIEGEGRVSDKVFGFQSCRTERLAYLADRTGALFKGRFGTPGEYYRPTFTVAHRARKRTSFSSGEVS